MYTFLLSSSLSGVRSLILFPLFATGVTGKFAAGIVDTGGKFATCVNNTRGTGGKICRRCRWYRRQICHWCRWHRWCTLTWEYLREFLKKFEMILMLLSGAWGKVIHEKNLKQKISWHCPFNKKKSIPFRGSSAPTPSPILLNPDSKHCSTPTLKYIACSY